MNMFKKSLLVLSLAIASTATYVNAQSDTTNASGNPHIEMYVKKLCGDDTACADSKRAQYEERMASYNEYVNSQCGDDQTCRQELHAKYMERRAKREERIAAHCGDDEACRDKLREQYSMRMKEGREKCGQDKDCWNKFYEENKPEEN